MAGNSLKNAVTIMEEYRGRDKVMRTVSFAACMVGGILAKQQRLSAAEKWFKLSTEIGACRTVLRLFDDLSMLGHSMAYGFGKKERSIYDRLLDVVKNIIDQSFYPLEHIAWAADKGIIRIESSSKWWAASISAWAVSLVLGVVRAIKQIVILTAIIKKKSTKIDEHDSAEHKSKLIELRHNRNLQYLTIVQNSSDFCNAIHWIPNGPLWSGKLSHATVGALGVLSSSIGLYKILDAHNYL